ncbi:MAG: RNA polymerase sigma factor [Oscillospiraceae bacterium]|nr:RNA polymerase sigma factor [Oscillospiraceae bacterium]
MDSRIKGLLSNISKGDIDALGELYDITAERIFNYAHVILRNKEFAEDVTHDVFLQIHQQAFRVAKVSNPMGYIMIMVRNRAYNQTRVERRKSLSLYEVPETYVNEQLDDRIMLETALSKLPAVQREAIYLHLICGYTHKETAAIVNAPVVTIKWRYGNAIKKLKELMKQDDS